MPATTARTPLRVMAVFAACVLTATLSVGAPGLAIAAPVAVAAPDTSDAPATLAAFSAYTRFNIPGDDGTRDRTIEDEIVSLADGVPSGGYIRGAMFSWTSPPVAEALERAATRGVIVRLAVDREGADGSNQAAGNVAVSTLKGAHLDDITWCGSSAASVTGSSGCIANFATSINHNKFFTFSTSGSVKRIVLQTSQNLTFSQNNLFNNAVIIQEDYDLYDHFTRYFNELRAETKNNDFYASTEGYYKSPGTAVTVYHSPRATGDTVQNVLSYITQFESGCTVEIAQASFTDARQAVANELLRIANLGCKIRIVHSGMGSAVHDILAGSPNVTMKKYYDAEAGNIDGRVLEIHSKYLIVKGNYNGSAGRTIVFTGSHNLTGPSMTTHDETFMKIEHPTVSANFRSNFATLWSRAKCVNPPANENCVL
ncbi:MAG: phospholipase D-like domain-containing protein [Actinoplanes sp.]